jgi:multidrug resistance efflux pump
VHQPRLLVRVGGGLVLALLVGLLLARRWVALGGAGELVARGTLEATEVTIASEVTARIREVTVVEGQAVRAGDVLVRLDDTVLQLQYRQAGPAEQQLLGAQLSRYTLTAPVSGVVQRRSAEPGEVAVMGAPLLVLVDRTRLDLTVYVLQRDLGRVYVGQPVLVEAEALPGVTARGVVSAVAERAEFTPRNTQTPRDRLNLVYAVKIQLQELDRRLKAGMSVVARFVEP